MASIPDATLPYPTLNESDLPLGYGCWLVQAYRNSVPVPRHWSQKRKYLQGKRGIEKPPFVLPDFIEATGIGQMRQAYQVIGFRVQCLDAAGIPGNVPLVVCLLALSALVSWPELFGPRCGRMM